MRERDLDSLQYVVRPLPSGGKIVILDTGAIITPEEDAMLQALHSRSLGGIEAHLETLKKKGGADKFMSLYYVGYGDKSIGDCGSLTIFVEGISMLAAKAVQDSRLYSGQESSTRYIDFSLQRVVDPIANESSRETFARWFSFYLRSTEPLRGSLRQRFPRREGEDEKIYEKAIRARAFDTLRAFLPAGASTNIAWHTSIRHAADRLLILRHHPLEEVRTIAGVLEDALIEAFPSSFKGKRYEATEEYNRFSTAEENYFFESPSMPEFRIVADTVDRARLAMQRHVLEKRPPKTELPKYLAKYGTVEFAFLIDFGSFRDLQRHRAVTQRMPLLTALHGFEPWYLDELPDPMRREAEMLIEDQRTAIGGLNCSFAAIAQYYHPMGYRVYHTITGDLPALVYLVELRATRFVHPTLALRAHQMAAALLERFGEYGLNLYIDPEPGRFDIRRGTHDIVERSMINDTA